MDSDEYIRTTRVNAFVEAPFAAVKAASLVRYHVSHTQFFATPSCSARLDGEHQFLCFASVSLLDLGLNFDETIPNHQCPLM